jgi:hypothetical protein
MFRLLDQLSNISVRLLERGRFVHKKGVAYVAWALVESRRDVLAITRKRLLLNRIPCVLRRRREATTTIHVLIKLARVLLLSE